MESHTLDDTRRKMIELCLDAYKKRVSEQTGYVHLFYDAKDDLRAQTIPTLENMYYALALFRSRMSDEILEGRKIIEKILSFEVDGNFPIYLHQYPVCKDRSLSVHLLVVIHYLLKDYKGVLGDELARKVELLSKRIIAHALQSRDFKPFPFAAEVKFKAFLGELCAKEPKSSSEMGSYLIALHMMPSDEFVRNELVKIARHWNVSLGMCSSTIGYIEQEEYRPKATLFDLFMALESKTSQGLSHLPEGVLLHAPLVHPFSFDEPLPFVFGEWEVFLSKVEPSICSLYWKEGDALRSMSIESLGEFISFETDASNLKLTTKYPTILPEDEDNSEVAIYIDAKGPSELYIEGQRASVFSLEDKAVIQTQDKRLALSFNIDQEEGRFVAHLLKANRSQQISKQAYKAFDWKIGIRTLKRAPMATLSISLSLDEALEKSALKGVVA